MAINLRHKFASAKADGPDASFVQPSNWNDQHDLTMLTGNMLGRTAAGTGGVQEIPFTTAGLAVLQSADASAQRTAMGLKALALKDTIDAATLISDNIISFVKIAVSALASAADIRAGTGSKLVTPDVLLSAANWVSLTDASTVAVDHATGWNFVVTLSGNRAIGAPSNPKLGWPLNIRVKQDTTGNRVPSWSGNYDFGDYGVPIPSLGASQEDIYCFICITSSKYIFTGTRKRSD